MHVQKPQPDVPKDPDSPGQSINPGSRPTNPREIHPPRLPVELMAAAQEAPTWMKKT
jgi:hypothetical protein